MVRFHSFPVNVDGILLRDRQVKSKQRYISNKN